MRGSAIRSPRRSARGSRSEFLEEERRTLGPWWFAQEYECRFMDTVDQVFATEVIDKAITDEVAPLFGGA